jgi:hypothetical protein
MSKPMPKAEKIPAILTSINIDGFQYIAAYIESCQYMSHEHYTDILLFASDSSESQSCRCRATCSNVSGLGRFVSATAFEPNCSPTHGCSMRLRID